MSTEGRQDVLLGGRQYALCEHETCCSTSGRMLSDAGVFTMRGTLPKGLGGALVHRVHYRSQLDGVSCVSNALTRRTGLRSYFQLNCRAVGYLYSHLVSETRRLLTYSRACLLGTTSTMKSIAPLGFLTHMLSYLNLVRFRAKGSDKVATFTT